MGHVETGSRLEQLAGKMVGTAVSGGTKKQLRFAALRIGNEFCHAARRHGRMHQEYELVGEHETHRDKVFHRVERHICIKAAIDRMSTDSANEQRMPVGPGLSDEVGTDIAAGAAFVEHHDRLAQRISQFWGDNPAEQIRGSARCVGHDQSDRLGRVGLRVQSGGRREKPDTQ